VAAVQPGESRSPREAAAEPSERVTTVYTDDAEVLAKVERAVQPTANWPEPSPEPPRIDGTDIPVGDSDDDL